MTPVTIDTPSARWARQLGAEMRRRCEGIPGIRWDKYCPFRPGTPHLQHWKDGWRAARVGR